MSAFAFTGKATEDGDADDLPFDENKMEKAMQMLAGEADKINEDDPRQAANLMRKLSDMTGLEMGPSMNEALKRMEAGYFLRMDRAIETRSKPPLMLLMNKTIRVASVLESMRNRSMGS